MVKTAWQLFKEIKEMEKEERRLSDAYHVLLFDVFKARKKGISDDNSF